MTDKEINTIKRAFKIIERELQDKSYIDIENAGIFELTTRKQGKTYCGFANKEGTPKYSRRIRWKTKKVMRDRLCK